MNWWHFLALGLLIIGQSHDFAEGQHCKGTGNKNFKTPKYCELPIQPHLACVNHQKWPSPCRMPCSLMVIAPMVPKIVEAMNGYRNAAAVGLNGLPPAARMLTMRWDPLMADLAELAVFRCSVHRPPETFATTWADYPGFMADTSILSDDNAMTDEDIVLSHLQRWYDQNQFAYAESLTTLKSRNGEDISGFLHLVLGENYRVGCAGSKITINSTREQMTLCIFGADLKHRKPIYPVGKFAGEYCVCGPNLNYTNLCSFSENRVTDASNPATSVG